MFAGEVFSDVWQYGCNHRLSQFGILLPGLRPVDQAAQMVNADAEMPFLAPAPRQIELRFIIRFL